MWESLYGAQIPVELSAFWILAGSLSCGALQRSNATVRTKRYLCWIVHLVNEVRMCWDLGHWGTTSAGGWLDDTIVARRLVSLSSVKLLEVLLLAHQKKQKCGQISKKNSQMVVSSRQDQFHGRTRRTNSLDRGERLSWIHNKA